MRPYNTYRNPELSQPVSSVENTLTDRTSNSYASFDILRSLSESISVDCGSFEISEPTEYCQTPSATSHVAFVDPRVKEIRTPVESAPAAPVNRGPVKEQEPVKSSVNAVADIDDDNYDCMNDPNYRTQSSNNTNSPSFEELMARTAESIAKMREENRAVMSNSELPKEKREVASDSKQNTIRTETRSDVKASEPAAAPKKRWVNWEKTRKALFSRETVKLVVLSVAISVLFVSAVIYKNNQRRNNGLPETEDVVMDQSSDATQNPVQVNKITNSDNEFKASNNSDYWTPADNNWNDPVAPNQQAMNDPLQDEYQSPSFDVNPIGYEFSQDDFSNPEDAGRQLAPPHSSNNRNQYAETMPTYNVEPKYAEVSPAFGSQYNPNDYESPILEDDTVSGYSETGYNSNYMR